MLFNNRKPEEPVAKGGTTLVKDPFAAITPSPAPSVLQTRPSMGTPSRCVIDAGLVFTGNLESDRDVQLEGEFRGDITCPQLIVSRDATLLGNVVAEEVVVRGKVKGSIRAGQVMLQDTARVESEIFHTSLVVEQGAQFDGESHRTDRAVDDNPKLEELKAAAAEMRATEPEQTITKSAAA
jgi:cytoskeletal protein CcmA (bactofilin family)